MYVKPHLCCDYPTMNKDSYLTIIMLNRDLSSENDQLEADVFKPFFVTDCSFVIFAIPPQVLSVPELFLVSVQLTHDKTGAQHLHIARDDSNNVFRYNITFEHSLIFNIVTGLSRKTIGWICMYVQKVTVGVTHLIPLQFAHRYPSVFFFWQE